MTQSTPFDQQFMDQIDAEVLTHCPRLSDDPTFDDLNYLSSAFTDWFAGWDAATEVAARLVASRPALPVIPEGWRLWSLDWWGQYGYYSATVVTEASDEYGVLGHRTATHPTDPWAALNDAIAAIDPAAGEEVSL